jgi:hypothetical protein
LIKTSFVCFLAPQLPLPVATPEVLSMEDDEASSGDESESSDEILSTKSDEDDFVKMWEENAVEQPSCQIQEFDESKILAEIKFLTFDDDKRIFSKVENEILQKLEVQEEIKNLIFSGKLVQKMLEKRHSSKSVSSLDKNVLMSEKQSDSSMRDISTNPTKSQEKDITKATNESMDLSTSDNSTKTFDNSSSCMVKLTFGGQNARHEEAHATFEMSPEPEEDNSIRDILADIQVVQ